MSDFDDLKSVPNPIPSKTEIPLFLKLHKTQQNLKNWFTGAPEIDPKTLESVAESWKKNPKLYNSNIKILEPKRTQGDDTNINIIDNSHAKLVADIQNAVDEDDFEMARVLNEKLKILVAEEEAALSRKSDESTNSFDDDPNLGGSKKSKRRRQRVTNKRRPNKQKTNKRRRIKRKTNKRRR